MTIPPAWRSALREQRVERAWRSADLVKPRIAQAAVPIELHGAIDIAVVDQQLGRGSCPGCGLDRVLQRIAHHVELAAVHSDNLGPDGEAYVERGAIPQHASDLAVHADGEPARVSEI